MKNAIRRGRFEIPFQMIDEPVKFGVYDIFAQMVVLRAEALYYNKKIEYVAQSNMFEIVPGGEHPPFYDLLLDKKGKFVSLKKAV